MVAILTLVSEYITIFLPAIAYIITGIVAVIKLIGATKSIKDENAENTAATNKKLEEQNKRLDVIATENDELRREVKRLCKKIDKVGD